MPCQFFLETDVHSKAHGIIYSGKAGGPPRSSGMIKTTWGQKYAKVSFNIKRHHVSVSGVVGGYLPQQTNALQIPCRDG